LFCKQTWKKIRQIEMAKKFPRTKLTPHWRVPHPPLDLVWSQDKIFICCQDGVYQLEDEETKIQDLDDDDDDFDIFFNNDDDSHSSAKKRLCRDSMPERQVQTAVLKIKFKKPAISFATYDGSILLSLHRKNSSTHAFIEATDLTTFHCKNPNVCVLEQDDQEDLQVLTEQEDPCSWMYLCTRSSLQDDSILGQQQQKSKNNLCLFVRCFGKTMIGILDKDHKTSLNSISHPGSIKTKADLHLAPILKRQPAPKSLDLIQRIIDQQQVNLTQFQASPMSKDDISDILCVSRDIILVMSKHNLVQYVKSGRAVTKVVIPIAEPLAMRIKNDQECLILTAYGAVYQLDVPFEQHDDGAITSSSSSSDIVEKSSSSAQVLSDILEASRNLERLNLKRTDCEGQLEQVRICLRDRLDLSAKMVVEDDDNTLIFTVINTGLYDFIGRYWSLKLSINGLLRTFSLPMRSFRPRMRWKVKLKLGPVDVENLPLHGEHSNFEHYVPIKKVFL
jgi:hypothetical protein